MHGTDFYKNDLMIFKEGRRNIVNHINFGSLIYVVDGDNPNTMKIDRFHSLVAL